MASEMEARARTYVWEHGKCRRCDPNYRTSWVHDLAAFAREEVARALEEVATECAGSPGAVTTTDMMAVWLRARAAAIRTEETGGTG